MIENPKEEDNQVDEIGPGSFNSVVIMLAMGALEQLGIAPETKEGKTEPKPPNLQLARPLIDTLETLKEKTKGNLTKDEEALLDSVLLDLRLRYVKVRDETLQGGEETGKAASEKPETEDQAPKSRIILP
jgi:hypothetical protein